MIDLIAHIIIGLLFVILAAMMLPILINDFLYSNTNGIAIRILMGTFLSVIIFAFVVAASIECTIAILMIASNI